MTTKTFLFVAFALLATLRLSADDKEPYQVHGRVADSFTHSGLDSAFVTLFDADSTTVLHTDTIHKEQGWWGGNYLFNLSRGGLHYLRFEAPGYRTEWKKIEPKFSARRGSEQDLGTFLLHKLPNEGKDVELKEAGVKATRIKMVMRGDTIVYDAAAFQLGAGSMLDALIRQLPGVELKDGGKIYVNGRYVESLLVNGKDFFKGDPKIALDNLPAYMVGNVKVYEQTSEMNRALGIKQLDKKPLVMDVNLKRIYSFGWIANVDAGRGTNDRYAARFFGLRFSDYSRFSIFGNIGNINTSQEPGDNGEWNQDTQVSAPTATKTFGINGRIEDRQKRFWFGSNATYTHTNTDSRSETSTTNFLTGGDTYARSRSTSGERSDNFSATTHFVMAKESSGYFFYVSPTLSYNRFRRPGASYVANFSSDPFESYRGAALDSIFRPSATQYAILNSQSQLSWNEGHKLQSGVSFEGAVLVPGTQDNIFVEASYNYQNGTNRSFDISDLHYTHVDKNDYRRQFTDTPDKSQSVSASIHYQFRLKLNKKWDFAITPKYEYGYNYKNSPRSLFRLDSLNGWGYGSRQALQALPSTRDSLLRTLDIRNSYFSTSTNHTHKPSVTINLVKTINKGKSWDDTNSFNVELALNLPFSGDRLNYKRDAIDTTMTRHLSFINPSLNLTYVDNGLWSGLSFTRNGNAPSLLSSLRIVDTSNPLVINVNNPNLKNTYSDNISFNINKTTKDEIRSSVNWNYSITENAVSQSMLYNKTTGITTYRPENINGNWNTSLNLSHSRPLDKKKRIIANANLNGSYNHSVDLSSTTGTPARSIVHNYTVGGQLETQYKYKTYFCNPSITVNWTRATSSREGFSNISCVDFDYGFSAGAPLPWKMEISTDLRMYSRRGYEDKTMNTNHLIWNARLTKKLLKDKLMLQLDGFDILGNLSTVTRTLNAQGRIETWTNAIPRFFMLHAVYKFTIQPKKKEGN